MITEKKTLYVVTKSGEEYKQLRELVEANDDNGDEIVGVKDGTVRLFNLGETMWEKNALGENEKILFIGKVKKTSKLRKKAKYVDDNFGIRYGFCDTKYAFLEVNPRVLNDREKYLVFLKNLLDMPVSEGIVESKKSDKKRDGVEFSKKEKKIVKHTVAKKTIKRFIVPFGFIKDISDTQMEYNYIENQQYAYGLIHFYYYLMQNFMDQEIKVVEKQKEKKEKKKSKNKLDIMIEEETSNYNAAYSHMKASGENLYTMRVRSCDMIVNIKKLINSISNTPKEFESQIHEINANIKVFKDECEYAKKELEFARQSAAGALAGGASGAAIACVTPAAAMWVATTFGTASTGAAISTLSGAAATNAALAWLGGGTVAMGGAGVAGGQALLAMAGPIGAGVAAFSILTSIVIFNVKKNQLDKERKDYIGYLKQNTAIVLETSEAINLLSDKTQVLYDGLDYLYSECLPAFKKNYFDLDEEMQLRLGALVNNTNALAATIKETI